MQVQPDNIKAIIQKLRSLDLSSYPYDEIRKLISQFGKFGAIKFTLHPGKVLIRARPNRDGEHFNTRNQLSYKPKEFNTTYQRASTPNLSMFYGGTIPENIKKDEVNNARIIATLEAANLLRDKNQEGEQTITFSKWVVTKDIDLIAICHHKDFVRKSSHTEELFRAFVEWNKGLPKELSRRSMLITSYLASEFAKRDIKSDHDYMISAIFSEISTEKGVHGIYYPSVRTDGMGFNVAITPAATDSSLKLIVAGECKMYKKGDRTIVDNESVCTIDDDTKPFVLLPIAPEHHIGRDKVLEELNNTPPGTK